jgi:hypothetical protein
MCVTGVARATDADASRTAFRRGVQQASNGNYDAARDSFVEAYKLYPAPSILLNLGIMRWKTHEYLEAEQDLVRFLEEDAKAPENEVASARSALSEVREHLGTFRLRVAPSGARASLDDREVALIPGKFVDVRTTLGAHAVHVRADGFAPRDESVDVEAGEPAAVDLTLARAGTADMPGNVERGASGRRTAGIVLVGAGVASGAFAAFAALRAGSLASDYNTPNSGHFQDPDTRSTGVMFRTLADVSLGVALVAAGVGVYLIVTDTGSSQTAIVASPGFAGLRGRF